MKGLDTAGTFDMHPLRGVYVVNKVNKDTVHQYVCHYREGRKIKKQPSNSITMRSDGTGRRFCSKRTNQQIKNKSEKIAVLFIL